METCENWGHWEVGESPAGRAPALDRGMEPILHDGDPKKSGALGRGDAVPVQEG